MKNIYIALMSFVIGAGAASAQTTMFELKSVTGPTVIVSDNDIFHHTTTPGAYLQHTFKLKNLTAASRTVSVRKYEDLVNTVNASDKAEITFCNGSTCYPPSVNTVPFEMAANETLDFKADITEASQIGESIIRYKFTNFEDANDNITIVLKYNSPTSVESFGTVLTNVSNIYPNPTNGKSFLNIQSKGEVQGLQLTIINALGSQVSSKNIDISKGNNTIALESENLSAGLYFVNLKGGNIHITKKITVK